MHYLALLCQYYRDFLPRWTAHRVDPMFEPECNPKLDPAHRLYPNFLLILADKLVSKQRGCFPFVNIVLIKLLLICQHSATKNANEMRMW